MAVGPNGVAGWPREFLVLRLDDRQSRVSELNAAIGSGTIVTLCFDINHRLAK